MFLGGLERVGVKACNVTSALLVRRVQSDIEVESRLQTADRKNWHPCSHIADQFSRLRVVDFHHEHLGQATVEAVDALYV